MNEINKKVQFEDIDIYGIIHHPKVLYYFERLRNAFFEENGISINRIEYGIVLKKISIDYKAPLMMFDNIVIRQVVEEIKKYKFTLKYYILKESKTMVTSSIDFIIFDLKNKKMISVPDEIILILNKNKEIADS